MKENENQKSLDGLEEFEKPKGLTFGEVREHLLSGGSVKRKGWTEYPHKAFYAPQIESMIVVNINNEPVYPYSFEQCMMSDDLEIIK